MLASCERNYLRASFAMPALATDPFLESFCWTRLRLTADKNRERHFADIRTSRQCLTEDVQALRRPSVGHCLPTSVNTRSRCSVYFHQWQDQHQSPKCWKCPLHFSA